jgi:hypothetical protein
VTDNRNYPICILLIQLGVALPVSALGRRLAPGMAWRTANAALALPLLAIPGRLLFRWAA